jgi:hypothetical protein
LISNNPAIHKQLDFSKLNYFDKDVVFITPSLLAKAAFNCFTSRGQSKAADIG